MVKCPENISYKYIIMLGLRSYIIQSDDIIKVADWYKIAFETEPYFENKNYIGFNIWGHELGIFKRDSSYLTLWNTSEVYWWVDDVKSELDRLVLLWAIPKDLPTEVGGWIIMASVIDPFWNFVGIIYNPLV